MTTATTEYRIDWPSIGRSFSNERRDAIAEWLVQLDAGILAHVGFDVWHDITSGSVSLPFGQGHAIKAAIREFKLPKVTHVAHSNRFAEGGCGIIAMRAHYKSGRVDIVMMDDGVSLTPVACRVWEGGAS